MKLLFTRFDQNGNGAIAKSEWRGHTQAFDKLDDNHDGQVSFEEFVGVS